MGDVVESRAGDHDRAAVETGEPIGLGTPVAAVGVLTDEWPLMSGTA